MSVGRLGAGCVDVSVAGADTRGAGQNSLRGGGGSLRSEAVGDGETYVRVSSVVMGGDGEKGAGLGLCRGDRAVALVGEDREVSGDWMLRVSRAGVGLGAGGGEVERGDLGRDAPGSGREVRVGVDVVVVGARVGRGGGTPRLAGMAARARRALTGGDTGGDTGGERRCLRACALERVSRAKCMASNTDMPGMSMVV